MEPELFGTLLLVVGNLVDLGVLAALALNLVWVYRDAEARGKTGCLWLLLAFFTWPPGGWRAFIQKSADYYKS